MAERIKLGGSGKYYSQYANKDVKGSGSNKEILSKYGRNLNQLARQGDTTPCIGRNLEMDLIELSVGKRKKSNAVLVGEPGVGKTDIAKGLAQKIESGDVSEALVNRVIYDLPMSALVSGTRYRGDFEERLEKLINELKENPEIIWFLDEIHTVIGAGSAEQAMDGADILKPALASGEISVIGATTTEEYEKLSEDKAFRRRFNVINVNQPTIEETIEILKGVKASYENHHGIIYTPRVLEVIPRIVREYNPTEYDPDASIDFMDTLGSMMQKERYSGLSDSNRVVLENVYVLACMFYNTNMKDIKDFIKADKNGQ